MTRIWNSIVGKLWVTILLLVSFVLFICTVLMLEFLSNFNTQQAEKSLRQEANTIARIVNEHETLASTESIISDILGEETNALVSAKKNDVKYSLQQGMNQQEIRKKIISDPAFDKVYTSNKPIVKEMLLPSTVEEDHMETYIVLASPINVDDEMHGAVFIYKSPDAIHRTTKETTKIVFLSAAIALVLTTFFA